MYDLYDLYACSPIFNMFQPRSWLPAGLRCEALDVSFLYLETFFFVFLVGFLCLKMFLRV